MWKSSPTLIFSSITHRGAGGGELARAGMLRLLQWGRRRWPLRTISRREHDAAARLLAMVPASRRWMADLGCGTGSAPARLRTEPCLGVDRSRRLVRVSRYAEAQRALCADLAALPLRPDRFGLLLAIGVAEYCRDPEPLLREAARLLAHEGHLLLTVTPAGWHARFRRLLGSPVYIHQEELLAGLFRKYHFLLKARQITATQHLYLVISCASADSMRSVAGSGVLRIDEEREEGRIFQNGDET